MSLNSSEISGVVVLYNPGPEVIQGIESFIDFIGKLYVVDNSERVNETLHKLLQQRFGQKAAFFINNENKGIASALNQAAVVAVSEGFSWLLTMDQDSQFSSGSMVCLIKHLISYANRDQVGIFSGHLIIQNAKDELKMKGVTALQTALTSGSLLNLKAYQLAGPFMDKFFIDQVDHEYSLRLRKYGYAILQCNEAELKHQLGNTNTHSFFGRLLNISNHNYIRRYYLTRNRLCVCKQYFFVFPGYSLMLIWFSLTDIILIAAFEKDKIKKFHSILLGTMDFILGRYGEYSHNQIDK